MAILKKYNLAGTEVGQVEVADKLLESTANTQMIKDYLVAIRNNARQWSAKTKSRAEVSHSGKKPHPQKGTGRARQGYLGAPQYKGGGRVHAPKPKFDQHIRINQKEKRLAICKLLADKIQGNKVRVLEVEPLKEPKTKKVAQFLEAMKCSGKRVLFVGERSAPAKGKQKAPASLSEKYQTFCKSLRNIPKAQFLFLPNASGYDIAVSHEIVILEPAVEDLVNLMSKGS